MQWLMLQQKTPEDFVIATGQHYSVRDFVNFAWSYLGKEIRWEEKGINEKGFDKVELHRVFLSCCIWLLCD